MADNKKELKREYKENQRPMGVYQIRNMVNGKVLIGSSPDLPGIFNRHKIALSAGLHDNKQLQADWHEYSAEQFAFETLDELSATEGPAHNYRDDLTFLEDLWLEKLEPYGPRGYNQRKKSREEKLKQITQNRLGSM